MPVAPPDTRVLPCADLASSRAPDPGPRIREPARSSGGASRSPLSESSAGPLRTHALLPREPWRRNQVAVTVAAAMVFLGFTLVTPFLPFYIQTLGIHEMRSVALWSGVLLTITPLLASILGCQNGKSRLAGRRLGRIKAHATAGSVDLNT